MIIYSRADVARELGVTPSAVSNWIRRHNNTPKAQYRTTDHVMYWDQIGLAAWQAWTNARDGKVQVAGLPAGTKSGTKRKG